MEKSKKILFISIVLICLLATIYFIAAHKKSFPIRSFCYWKTSLSLSSDEDSVMKRIEIQHLYLRYFDVDWNPYKKEALPVGTIDTWYNAHLKEIKLTPCVFITNAVMENASEEQLKVLAGNVISRINSILSKQSDRYANKMADPYNNYYYRDSVINKDSLKLVRDSVQSFSYTEFKSKITEILIDCDWTASTKDKYFLFLNYLKEVCDNYTISATVRLWQYKDKKISGIPPVSRCLLMCYNLNSPAQYNLKNSICSLDELKKYITDDSYPIMMDVALPIFNSGVIFRNGAFKGLISNINLSDYESDTVNYQRIKEKLFRFKTDQVIGNTLIRNGDELRIEQLSKKELEDIVLFLSNKLELNKNSRITFFSWDTNYIKNYGIDNIKKYYQLFEH